MFTLHSLLSSSSSSSSMWGQKFQALLFPFKQTKNFLGYWSRWRWEFLFFIGVEEYKGQIESIGFKAEPSVGDCFSQYDFIKL